MRKCIWMSKLEIESHNNRSLYFMVKFGVKELGQAKILHFQCSENSRFYECFTRCIFKLQVGQSAGRCLII